jgi:hypothetical protein
MVGLVVERRLAGPQCFRLSPFTRACRAALVAFQWVDYRRRLQQRMQLCHTHRQLLSRCTLRWYSVGTSSDTVATSNGQVPPRLKRPLASTFGGINIRTSRLLVSPNFNRFHSPFFL